MPETVHYLTATQAARLIGVNERTVRLWIKGGKLSASQPATNRLAIPMSEIERVIAERAAAAALEQVPAPADLARQVAELTRQVAELTRQVESLQEELRASDALHLDARIQRRDDLETARPVRPKPARRQQSAESTSDIETVILDTLAGASEPIPARKMYQNRERLRLANQNGELEPTLARLVEVRAIVRAGQTIKGTWLYALPDDEQGDQDNEP